MVSKGDSYSLVKVVARLEYAYLANAANENSGSIKQLILDAGLKRNESGFAVMPLVNYEEYYTKAKVSQWQVLNLFLFVHFFQFSILLSFVNPKIDDAFDLFFV